MNQFLMASLDFDFYRQAFLARLNETTARLGPSIEVDLATAQSTYRWDTLEVASFKYLFNFLVASDTRDQIVKSIFEENLSDEESFSRTLYISWQEARAMQAEGMIIGGHSHQHKPLSTLSNQTLEWDLATSMSLLAQHLRPQTLWPFSYPYGSKESFTDSAVARLKRLGFSCSFSTVVGTNPPGTDAFAVKRFDCNDSSTA